MVRIRSNIIPVSKDSPQGRNPVVIFCPGVGSFARINKQPGNCEFYINAINVMRGAEAISKYTSLPRQEAFNIEYWLLEEAKLQRQPKEKPLSRKVALVTGSGGGIGRAIADKLIAEGANVVFTDISKKYLEEATLNYSSDQAIGCQCDVTKAESLEDAIQETCLQFGGLDIVVHSAGLAISKPLVDTTEADWNLLQNVLVKGQFLLSKLAARIMKLNFESNNVGYGTAKAAQMAAGSQFQIRSGSTINPDGAIV